jgi:hypothetical protein
MSYRQQSPRNWGVAVACLVAVPLGFAWTVISIIGGSLVCADAAAHCDGVVWPLVQGVVLIAVAATALGWVVNLAVRAMTGNR